jgi:hypothetical protein
LHVFEGEPFENQCIVPPYPLKHHLKDKKDLIENKFEKENVNP